MNTVKVLRNGITIPSKYIKDIERLSDRVRKQLDDGLSSLGLPPFSSDIIYRDSAAWKDYPIHYCYIGDYSFSSVDLSSLSESCSPRILSKIRSIRYYLSLLIGYSQVVWELGGQLTFDEHGKHTVFFQGCHF